MSRWVRNVSIVVGAAAAVAGMAGMAGAVPVLQVGIPNGSGGYVTNTNVSPDMESAHTTGSSLVVGGLYSDHNVVQLGGQFAGGLVTGYQGNTAYTGTVGAGLGWSAFGFDSAFNGSGALLMVTVPDGQLANAALRISLNGGAYLNPVYTTATWLDGFVWNEAGSPGAHAPIPNQDYLFFDIGNFGKLVQVPNFQDSGDPSKIGEIKAITLGLLGVTSDVEWLHFDALALETNLDVKKNDLNVKVVVLGSTDLENNPGSHDATWDNENFPPQEVVPEPGTMVLLGTGLLGLSAAARRKGRKS